MAEFSFADLIAPVPGDSPAGSDVRHAGSGSDLYLAVKDDRGSARIAEREALVSGDPEVDPLNAGVRIWAQVADGAAEILARHSKDLQVAAWLVEAWLRTDGLAGLADGLSLLAELVEHYWNDGLFPVEEADEPEARLAPLFGLFGREEPGALIQPIKLLPLTDQPGPPVALWTIETARAQSARHDDPDIREELVMRREQRIGALDTAIAGASAEFVETSLDAIDRSLAELDRLMDAIDANTSQGRFGSQIVAPLEAIAHVLKQHHPAFARGDVAVETMTVSATTDTETAIATVSPESQPKQKVLDRSAALATLLEVAGYFDRTEPQSLIGHSLREVVRRAKLPLDDLLAELMPDQEQRAMFMLRAGIRAGLAGDGGGGTYSSF